MKWPEDARHIIDWARGGAVSIDHLVAEFEAWSDHFAPTAALWPDADVVHEHVHIAGQT
jgi:hypothetical protein